jgi:Na+-transporting NADH:ubiquinone oxidoreductase subunit NqrE
MEKRSFLYYFGLFVLVVFIGLAFSAGNWMIIDFVTELEPNQIDLYPWLPFLGAVSFFVGYFAALFSMQNQTNVKHRLILAACIFLPVIAISFVVFRTPEYRDVRQLLFAGMEYYVAGSLFGWISERFKAAIKT